ncbi:S-adenosyl-methyltransferase MraW [Planctopirus limnophila DSM 3776]|uniref:Ribosomal RNA small subunit methyltransferase H n=1 Tax=Planctopirus limnophila (strain ATCC 43296 / DSM 3776 / IFAM 1008 / Mu 290) TaxID=521674 RepID=D5SY39_PLAL2|nr:16S rRNA (cytosine(1402)-N(4))-methyltransferase RsmH [Planctopirus limnophila]ADG69832.1 S-adenosyl-methyltransferase MraW [Planctopirus limnophila DSM 3776]
MTESDQPFPDKAPESSPVEPHVPIPVPEQDPGKRPARRVRYAGTHPRKFHEKYKELARDRYAADVEKILKSGKTPAGTHRPIMVDEILQVLAPQAGERGIDCTLGFGGHAQQLLRAIQPDGCLLGIDADPIELPKTEARLRSAGFPAETLMVQRTNFAALPGLIPAFLPGGADFLMADLGLSSMQIDDPARGFTFKVDAPLDMRMNPSRGPSAAEFLAKIDERGLAKLLEDAADEPCAEPLARGLITAQQISAFITTGQLAEAVRRVLATIGSLDEEDVSSTIRRVFQAIRIAVNDEFSTLDILLKSIPQCVKPGGRIAILTFHSGEDRRVKKAFQAGLASGVYREISSEVMRATPQERHDNPRSIPAKLRWAIRSSS